MDRAEMMALWAEVKENHRRLDACARHTFPPVDVRKNPRAKHVCIHCGGSMDLMDVGLYIRGYVAGGRDANDIWPGWNDRFEVGGRA